MPVASPSPSASRSPSPSPALRLLPLGALAAGFGLLGAAAVAQTTSPVAAAPTEAVMQPISVKARTETDANSVRATTSGIGKGNQELRDIPQSVTVVTEKLIDDRRIDTLKEALHQTAGITFQAAEGGEEDIRLRGFSLAASGDIYVDGIRDPAFYARDTFNFERIELLRGSASMLFGRGSTGGVVNQVSKLPYLLDAHEVQATVGTGHYARITGDFNIRTGESSALRINVMKTDADQWGNGLDKEGIAPTFRWGIGSADEFTASLYHLRNDNGINYGIPWLRKNSSSTSPAGLIDIDPRNYYNARSDYSAGGVTYGNLSHAHRFRDGGKLTTTLRHGKYERDQRAGAIRFCVDRGSDPDCPAVAPTQATINDATILRIGTNNKVQDMTTTYLQSDYSNRFDWFGVRNEVLTGVDIAHEVFHNYNLDVPAGVTLDKNTPRVTIGSPNPGNWVDESLRTKSLGREFDAQALGVYFQDMVQVAPDWKVLGGLRWDYFKGDYHSAATVDRFGNPVAAADRSRSDSLWSKRLGVLYQPSDTMSFHFSYGTSFNTSGDTYQYDDQSQNTPPESSENLELGAKIDAFDGRVSTRVAIFRATKRHERNRDPDSAATQAVLSGKRHTAGIEFDIAGRITPAWEVYGSYVWTPVATIDVGAPGSTPGVREGAGTRSSMTPRHSGTIWTTYKVTPQWRIGGGLNARSSQTPNRNPVGVTAPSWVTADLMAEYTLSDSLRLQLNINNVTDKLYADALYSGHYVPGAPRSVQLSLSARF